MAKEPSPARPIGRAKVPQSTQWTSALAAFIVLFGPVSCLSDVGPEPFTTAGSCYPGDLQDCTCKTDDGEKHTGVQTCGADKKFVATCRCEGCSVYPDCSKCSAGCFDTCICETVGNEAECQAKCAAEAGK